MNKNRGVLGFLLLGMVLGIVLGIPTSSATEIQSYVQDNAHIFSASDKLALERTLEAFPSQAQGAQLVVFTEDRIPEGMTLEERSLALAEASGIGDTQEDNGILLYLAVQDKQFRWEVGYGMEPILNAALLGRMSRQVMVPEFQSQQYSAGITAGVQAVQELIRGEVAPEVYAEDTSNNLAVIIFWIVLFIVLTTLQHSARKRRNSFEDGVYIGAMSGLLLGGRRGGGLGGMGGFSGGGGSFGGGGFSGGW